MSRLTADDKAFDAGAVGVNALANPTIFIQPRCRRRTTRCQKDCRMLVTNFHLKRLLYVVMCGFRQLRDVAEVHPARAMALRALDRTVDFIEREMPNALGLEKKRPPAFPSPRSPRWPYVEFGVFTGGTTLHSQAHQGAALAWL